MAFQVQYPSDRKAAFVNFLYAAQTLLIASLVQTTSPTNPPSKARNHEFVIAATASSRVSGSTSQAVVNAFVQRLLQQGFKRVQILDVQCCAVQVDLVSATANSITAKVTVLDVDKQSVYSKQYQGSAGNGMESAAAALADRALADKDFLKAMAGT